MENILNQNWRNYSQSQGKRRKMNHIPVGGQINENLRAMGTKRIPVLKRNFSYVNNDPIINFAAITHTSQPSNENPPELSLNRYHRRKNVQLDYLTPNELKKLTPDEIAALEKKQREEEEAARIKLNNQNSRKMRSTVRLGLETVRESRNWGRALGLLPIE